MADDDGGKDCNNGGGGSGGAPNRLKGLLLQKRSRDDVVLESTVGGR